MRPLQWLDGEYNKVAQFCAGEKTNPSPQAQGGEQPVLPERQVGMGVGFYRASTS